jgi:two-component system chemotaxis response regulator CheY
VAKISTTTSSTTATGTTKINPSKIVPKKAHPKLNPDTNSGSPNQLRALIVDDSSIMRKIVDRSLRQAGLDLQIIEATNGAEALAALQENTVDLILCDINMPVMDGLEFVNKLANLENAKGVPVVMITTEGSEASVLKALSAGASGYIRKPFTPDQVKAHVLPLLEAKALEAKTLEPKP